jgi:hypothetical protein
MKYLKLFEDYKQEELCKECDCKISECKCNETSEEANEAKKEGTKPKNKKEKELAAKYPPKDKITRGDFITVAKENADKKKGGKSEKPTKLTSAQKKLPEGLRKAIEARKKK